jgi:hypothetical protein
MILMMNLAQADEVRLENGSRIKGKVVRLEDSLLFFKSNMQMKQKSTGRK